MNYPIAIEFIYGLQKFGLKLGLERIANILYLLNNPHNSFDSIHIAGTNGKGSVSAMISSMLIEASLKTGLFTSPHLVSFTERIRINNQEITEQEVIELTRSIKSVLEQNCINSTTFFEFVTALCFLYFAQKHIDCAVVETGLGGRLDATNILNPKISVITKIGIDHTEYLGNTIQEIASEKAGIIKANRPLIISLQNEDALMILTKRARELNAPIYTYGIDFTGILRKSNYKGNWIDFKGEINIDNIYVPLAGSHQVENCSTAIRAVYEYLKERYEKRIVEDIILNGLNKVRWQGRLQFISFNPPLLLDGAHNPQASERLTEFIRTHLSGSKIIIIIGIMADKDIKGILSHLLPIAHWTIFTKPQYSRSAHPDELSKIAQSLGFDKYEKTLNINEAMSKVGDLTGFSLDDFKKGMTNRENDNISEDVPIVLITGSFYLLGEVLELLGERSLYRDLRENFDNTVRVK